MEVAESHLVDIVKENRKGYTQVQYDRAVKAWNLYHELGENQFKHLFADAEYDYDDAKGFIIILPNSTMKRIILQQCSTFLRAGYERHMGKKFSEEHLKVTIIE